MCCCIECCTCWYDYDCSIEWPGKEHHTTKPKGYAYVIFESEKQIRALLGSCTVQDGNATNARKYFYKISAKCLKPQKVGRWFS